MKKRITAIILTAVLLISTACVALNAYAAGGVETPMVPIQSSFAYIKLDSDSSDVAYSQQSVTFSTSVTSVNSAGVSAITLTYEISDGLEYNGDFKVIGMPEGWVLEDDISGNRATFTVKDEAKTNAVYSGLSFTFSCKVTSATDSTVYVKLVSADVIDGYGDRISGVTKKEENNQLVVKPSVPLVDNIGAALRINNTPAMRLGTVVHKDRHFMTYFENGSYVWSNNADMKFGMMVIETAKLRGELTTSTSGAEKVIFEEVFSENDTEVMFVHTIGSVNDYTKSYSFCPFVMYREAGEDQYSVVYGETKARSARDVAQAELLSETNKQKVEMLNKFTK